MTKHEQSYESDIMSICRIFEIPFERLFARTRVAPLPDYRFLVYKFLRDVRRMKLKDIANRFGKDHTSVIHGIQMADNRIQTEERFANLWAEILLMFTAKPFTSLGKNRVGVVR